MTAARLPPGRRLVALFAAITLGLAGILTRLVLLQVKDASAYTALALRQRLRQVRVPAVRGSIFDRNGRELAMSLPARAVFADPSLVRNRVATARVVGSALGLSSRDVLTALRRPGRFVYLARGMSVEAVRPLQARRLPGIGFLPETRRHYPAGPLAPQVLGFVGVDGAGLGGLELEYQDVLAGRVGHAVVEEDPDGALIPQGANVEVPPEAGDHILLTLDADIQFRAQRALAAAARANGAKGGTITVMDPATGEILAMAGYPWFDPEDFLRADPDRLRNRAVTDPYEPGSVTKVVAAAAALEEGAVRPGQRLAIPNRYRLYGKVFQDAHSDLPPRMTLADILAHSSNVGAITVASLLGKDRFSAYLYRFGLHQRTGLRFPGESAGLLPPPERWSGTSMGTIPIGQGIAVTPLQMAAVYGAIANGGVWVQPRLVRGVVEEGGRMRQPPPPRTRRVISAETARLVARMLAFAVDAGTGGHAQVPGYWVAGKTGTARKPLEGRRGYGDKYVASFFGFAPASRPALVIAVTLDEPDTMFGGIAAAPLFREVARFGLARLRVPPGDKLTPPPHTASVGEG